MTSNKVEGRPSTLTRGVKIVILPCTNTKCVHPYQDKTYGRGNRVMNPIQERQNGQKGYRCTVCSTIVTRTVATKQQKESKAG